MGGCNSLPYQIYLRPVDVTTSMNCIRPLGAKKSYLPVGQPFSIQGRTENYFHSFLSDMCPSGMNTRAIKGMTIFLYLISSLANLSVFLSLQYLGIDTCITKLMV